jgi:outer membrane autotransporter protein
MRKHIALGTVMALGLGTQAMAAEGFSYSNVEASYVKTEIDDFDVDGDGFSVAGSAEFSENFFGFASYKDINYDLGVSGKQFSLGLGFNWALTPALDLVSGVSYEDVKVSLDGGEGSVSDDGFGVGVGLRGRVGEALELTGGVKYTDLGGGADDTTLSVGARYYFTPAFAAGVDVSDNDDGTTWGIVLRYDFGS